VSTRISRLTLAAGMGAMMVLGGATYGVIQMAGAAGSITTYYACLKGGKLTEVGTSSPTCPTGATVISWNSTGPKGPKGPRGPSNSFYATGTTIHIQSTLSPIESISLGAGTYVVDADVWLDDVSPSNASDLAVCELALGTASDEVEVGLLGPSGAPQNEGTLSMTVAATIASAGTATVSCVGEGNTGLTYAHTVNMTAIQSSSLSS
jgi:hypothetical protein